MKVIITYNFQFSAQTRPALAAFKQPLVLNAAAIGTIINYNRQYILLYKCARNRDTNFLSQSGFKTDNKLLPD